MPSEGLAVSSDVSEMQVLTCVGNSPTTYSADNKNSDFAVIALRQKCLLSMSRLPASSSGASGANAPPKRRVTFQERSALDMSKASFEATRGPAALLRSQKSKPPAKANCPKQSVKQVRLNEPAGGDTDAQNGHRDCGPLKFSFGLPEDEWQSYLQLVADGHVRFLQIDRRTWLAEQYDLQNDNRIVCFSFN